MAPPRPGRPRSRPALRRWTALLLPLALVFSLLGRGHAFQAMGWLPCCDDGPASAEVQREHDDGRDSGDAHQDCPADCHRCPCGQIPMVPPPLAVPPLRALLDVIELDSPSPPAVRGEAHVHRVDRPPRPSVLLLS